MLSFIKDFVNQNVPILLKPKEANAQNIELSQYLGNYLENYGHALEPFADRVRVCFVEAQCHQLRLKYAEAIATHLGLDMKIHENRKEIWKTAALEHVLPRPVQMRWKSEDLDRSFDPLIVFYNKIRMGYANNLHDNYWTHFNSDTSLEFVQNAIKRTLTFIRVFPPKKIPKKPMAELISEDEYNGNLKRCWEKLKEHDSYAKHKQWTVNQFALDCVYDDPELKKSYTLNSSEINRLKLWVEADLKSAEEPKIKQFLHAWLIFKYATYIRIEDRDFQGRNPHEWIWLEAMPSYHRLWNSQ